MKISTIKNITRDGMANIYKNKVMTLASVAIVTATIFIFGILLAIFMNIRANVSDLKKSPMIEVFCDENLDDARVDEIEKEITNNEDVMNCIKVTKQEALNKVKELLGEEKDILDGIDDDFLPVSFEVSLYDINDTEQFIEFIKDMNGVEDYKYSIDELNFINKVSHVLNIVSIILIAVFLVASVGIIANTIKLTVSARSREISIMKYVGASDIFVRGPFIIEGTIIGIIGAMIAFVIVGHGYGLITSNIAGEVYEKIKILSLGEIVNKCLICFLSLGCVLGATSGVLSVQKYLKEL